MIQLQLDRKQESNFAKTESKGNRMVLCAVTLTRSCREMERLELETHLCEIAGGRPIVLWAREDPYPIDIASKLMIFANRVIEFSRVDVEAQNQLDLCDAVSQGEERGLWVRNPINCDCCQPVAVYSAHVITTRAFKNSLLQAVSQEMDKDPEWRVITICLPESGETVRWSQFLRNCPTNLTPPKGSRLFIQVEPETASKALQRLLDFGVRKKIWNLLTDVE